VGRNIKGKKLSDRPVMLAISRRENIPQALSFRSQAWCVRASLIEIDADADLSTVFAAAGRLADREPSSVVGRENGLGSRHKG
jgi:hypothetical protein